MELTIGMAHDNCAAIIWNRKGSTSTTGPAAYLLQLQSLHTHHHCCTPLHDFIPGHLNQLADKASRWFEWSDEQRFTHFNMHYPQPRPWQLSHLQPEMHSMLTSCLRKRRLNPASWLSDPLPLTTSQPAINTHNLAQFLMPYKMWAKHTNGWGPLTSKWTVMEKSTSNLADNSDGAPNKSST